MDCKKEEIIEEYELQPPMINLSIPKVEPLCFSPLNSNEGSTSNVDEMMISTIPFIRAYKVRDPIVLLERCDKIWETLKVIKDVQHTKVVDASNLPSIETTAKSLYIKYQPVLSNNNGALPNFKLSVKATKKLYHCSTCGKQYSENRGLRYHSEKAHGIYIPLKRLPKSVYYNRNGKEKEKQKEHSTIEEEKKESSDSKFHSKENENNSSINISLQSASSTGSSAVHPDVHSQQRKSDVSISPSQGDDTNEPIRKEQEKRVSNKELEQNANSISLHDSTSLICLLCKQSVKDMREHLIDYHKIESPEFMLENLNNSSVLSENENLKTHVKNNKDSTQSETVQEEHSSRCPAIEKRALNEPDTDSRKRHKVNNDDSALKMYKLLGNMVQCDICLGTYTKLSFNKHRRSHRERGETKENFHLSNFKYRKSPLSLKSKVNVHLNDASSDNTSDCNNSNLFRNKSTDRVNIRNGNKNETSNKIYNKRHANSCFCGRSFRDPHTLFVHKAKCRDVPNKGIKPSTRSSFNDSSQCSTGNSSDKDSGIGISITIKKKNNSYEIIDKDSSKVSASALPKDVDRSLNTLENVAQVELQNKPPEALELSKYSDNHSILKIQLVNEDVDIDVEEDSQITSINNNNISSAHEVTDNDFNQKKQLEIKIERDDELNEGNMNSDLLENTILTKIKHKISAKQNLLRKYNICVCGRKFYTRKALEVHTNKHHSSSKLICGYCKIICHNAAAWNKHQCFVNEGKRFIDLPFGINCYNCSATLSSSKKFDAHIKRKHFDTVLPYQCFECCKRFHNVTARKEHFEEEHGITICTICNSKCRHSMISRHKAYHYGLGFPCHICKKTYATQTNLSRHRTRVHRREMSTAKSDFYELPSLFPKSYDFQKKSDASKKSFSSNKNIEVGR